MNIFVIGHYGGQNTGDQAMLKVLVCELAKKGHYVTYISRNIEDHPFSSEMIGVSAVVPKIADVIRAVYESDWIVLGGGTHFHDDYPLRRLLRHYRYMARLSIVSGLGKALGKKVAYISMGFGPFRTFLGRLIFRTSLLFADFISVRDCNSLTELNKFRYRAQCVLAFDLAAGLLNEISNKEVKQKLILGISPTLLHGAEQRVGMSSHVFWRLVAQLVAEEVTRREISVRVFEFRGGDRESDRDLVRIFINTLKNAGIEVEYIPYMKNPTDTLLKIKECKWFIASRFHSALLAYLAELPMLIIPYHRKLIDLAHDIQLNPQALVDIEREGWHSKIKGQLADLLENATKYVAVRPITDAVEAAKRNFEFLQLKDEKK